MILLCRSKKPACCSSSRQPGLEEAALMRSIQHGKAPAAGRLAVLQVAASVAPGDGGPTAVILGLNRALRERGINSRIFTTDADGAQRLASEELGALQAELGGNLRV